MMNVTGNLYFNATNQKYSKLARIIKQKMSRHFPSFPVQENNAEIRWAKWISRLEDLFIGLDIKDKNDKDHCYYITVEKM
jgi:hypothetical protein